MSVEDEVFELTRELDIGGMPRLEMIADPERAAAVLRHALKAPRIRNRAGFAIANWRAGFDPRPSARPELELELEEGGPPPLWAIEHAWAIGTPLAEECLRAMAIAIGRAGGFASIDRATRYDLDGLRLPD